MEKTLRIGFMGVHGSFSEQAAIAFIEMEDIFQEGETKILPLTDAFNVRDALIIGTVDLGVVAIRNSTFGPVKEYAEAFNGVETIVISELSLPIHQCLFKRKDMPIEALTTVGSHPQALGQTRASRATLLPGLKEQELQDTSLSAKWLANGTLPPDFAVICSLEAGLMNGLELIKENIEDNPDNHTTFRLLRLP